ncbi:MAG: YlzJ-like family protein [Oscillospiraceae bacterium]|nr:YlzJ-like family protein [Oscillospiraceae bacterium]
MLYTVISEYDIFRRNEPLSKFRDIRAENGISTAKVEYTVSGKNKVVKSLFATDPRLYLSKKYTPGTHLK